MTRTNIVARMAALAAFAAPPACNTDLGDLGNYLECTDDGRCVEGYRCAQTELGAVCLDDTQWEARCAGPELCNGRDDDCDGEIDNGFTGIREPCELGIGACRAAALTACSVDGREVVCLAKEYPPTDEVCDGLDNDCDGDTDEELADVITGIDDGECMPQIERCVDGVLVEIQERIDPTDETCDGLDNDCDGETDEDLADVITGTDEGECAVRVERCIDGGWAAIAEGILPIEETCDDLDNDCDGAIDNDVPLAYRGTAIGECRIEITECIDGALVVVQAGVEPADDICDGRDNDCDGGTDELFALLGRSCAVGVGACVVSGVYQCNGDGSATVCDAVAGSPSAELCDGLDNNCDGDTDESFPELDEDCTVGVGECLADGIRVCRDDGFGTRCDAEPMAPGEESCDGLDNDCDGFIDGGLGDSCCTPGMSRDCGTDLGACTIGTQACTFERAWGVCSGQLPTDDVCDGLDNDCNGEVDEGIADCCSPAGGLISCSIDRGACVAGQQQCGGDGTWSDCSGVLPVIDRCDGLDNNCDGDTDELFPELGEPCSMGTGACARTGTLVCRGDGSRTTCSATEGTPSEEETCNRIDDDCNGEIDEGLVEFSGIDVGECQQGITRCIDGAFVVVQERIDSTDEVCDGFDQDCDGIADDDAPNCCQPSVVRTCGINRGVCTVGSQTCGEDRTWGDCTGVSPTSEFCDGRDNDCDGTTDNPWHLQLGSACMAGVGACSRLGVYECNPDFSPSSEGEREGVRCTAVPGNPGTESCNGIDDDCDGAVDEAVDVPPVIEGSSVGRCRPRILVCIDGEMSEVQAAVGPSPEICNGLDDDCSGTADNGIASVPCYEGPIGTDGVGACREGETVCTGGNAQCMNQVLPSVEMCDHVNNDCDDETDEDFRTGGCFIGDGACRRLGEMACQPDGTNACSDENGMPLVPGMPGDEICNGLDDDCDGAVDEVADVPPVTEGSSVGRCRPRVLACIDGEMTEVQASVGPSPEVCNGFDDDCSGAADNDIASVPCYEGPIGTDGVGTCREGTTSCTSGNTRCTNQVLPSDETCDNADNDCDGVTDGSLDVDGTAVPLEDACYTGPDGTAGVGECRVGTTTCTASLWGECVNETLPAAEVCGDADDSDCDGRPDGITFLEDFEDNCAMPEATVTTDVPLECIETPVDTTDPSRTPDGNRSLGIHLELIDANLQSILEWPIDACVSEVSGSIRIMFRMPFVESSGFLFHPQLIDLSARLIYYRGGSGAALYVEEIRPDGGVVEHDIPINLTPGRWFVLSWSFTNGNHLEYAIDGTTYYGEERSNAVEGVRFHIAVDTVSGATADVVIDDIRWSTPP